MTAFPSIMAPSFPLDEATFKPQIRTEFEAGYVQSRPRCTRARSRFELTWKAMPEADLATLRTFFETYQGDNFDWTHPTSATTYDVRFSGDTLDAKLVFNGHYEVSLTLEEV